VAEYKKVYLSPELYDKLLAIKEPGQTMAGIIEALYNNQYNHKRNIKGQFVGKYLVGGKDEKGQL
jgi:hypothetical protein